MDKSIGVNPYEVRYTRQVSWTPAIVLVLVWMLFSGMHGLAQPHYQYDEQGRLITSLREDIQSIEWNNHNRIVKIIRTGNSLQPDIEFIYDAKGNRICKIIKPRDGARLLSEENWQYTYYIHKDKDVMLSYTCTTSKRSDQNYVTTISQDYQKNFGMQIEGIERGSGALISRSFSANLSADGRFIDVEEQGLLVPPLTDGSRFSHQGDKAFQLQNHENNVLAVVSDRITNSLQAEVVSATDYFPFGMSMPQRELRGPYLFGFGNKEALNEFVDGVYDFGARLYDSRLSRWISVDARHADYPAVSPYVYSLNSPIQFRDPDGHKVIATKQFKDLYGQYYDALLKTTTFNSILKDYQGSRHFRFKVDDQQVDKISSEEGVNYFAVTKPFYFEKNNLRQKLVYTEAYFSSAGFKKEKSLVDVYGLKFLRTKSYSGLFIAFAIIHEAVHGLEDVKNFPLDKDKDHTSFNVYNELVFQALREYVQQEGLFYSRRQLESLSWHGTEGSKQFEGYIDRRLIESDMELNDENRANEKVRWRGEVDKLIYDVTYKIVPNK